MGDSYRQALKANKAKPYPLGCGKSSPQSAEEAIREKAIRWQHFRKSHRGHRAFNPSTQGRLAL